MTHRVIRAATASSHRTALDVICWARWPTGWLAPCSRAEPHPGRRIAFPPGRIDTFPIARTTRNCILRPVVQRFAHSENLFIFPGDEHGREERWSEERRSEKGRQEGREESSGEEGRRQEGGEAREEGEEVWRQAHAERCIHETDESEPAARHGGRDRAAAPHGSHEEAVGVHQAEGA